MTGTLLQNRYRLDSELGRGGMGVVYRAHDTLLDRDVAVKVLSAAALGAEGRARLLREAQAAAKLNHPHVVSIYDAGEAGGVPFIVMELVEGASLHERPPQSLDDILSISRQVCAALDHAHRHGIVHRDLKPENVLVTNLQSPISDLQPPREASTQSVQPPPAQVRVKLMDFGLARSAASRITTEGAVVGTVFYLAPELALGQPFDGRADLYALGAMLYEFTTGRLPFTADDPLAVISQHLHAPVVPPSTFRADLPPALNALIVKLLAKNPSDRFASAREVSLALDSLAAPETAAGRLAPEGALALLAGLARGRLVGRRAELAQLRQLWMRAQQGSGHLALISGEPGVGKTRLAHEAQVYAQLSGATVLRGGCYEYEAATPYLPFVEALREWAHAQPAESLRTRLGTAAPELARLAPEIETRLGPLPASPPLPPDEERLRLFDHVARFLQGLAGERGLLLFLDDLHWADQGTLSLLHYLLRRLRRDRCLVLAAYREVELDRAHPLAAALVEWNRERLATRLPLGRLSLDDTGALLATLFGQASVSVEFTTAMYRETEGNPFFVEEVVKSLVEQGQIYRENGGWGRRQISDLAIPQSIKEAIGRRLDRLSAASVDVLHTAAVLGKTFAFRDLAAAIGTGAPPAASPAGEEALLDALDEASAAQLIRSERGETFAFTHDKIREVLYEELNPIRRRRMHQRIGEALEKLYVLPHPTAREGGLRVGVDAHAADLAHHFGESGDLPKGLVYSLRAAQNAARVFAHDAALSFYERAREAAEALDQPAQLAAIYEAVAGVYAGRGLVQRSIENYERALALAPSAEGRAVLKSRIGAVYAAVGDDRGLPYLHAALQELNPAAQPNDLAHATAHLGRFHHYRGQHGLAIEYLEQARRLAEPLDVPATLTYIYAYLAGAYQHLTRYEESNEWARQCIALGERKNHPYPIAAGYEFLAENSFGLGKWQDVLEFSDRDRQIGERTGAQARVGWADFSRAYALHGLGDLAGGAASAQASLTLAEFIGDRRLAVLAGSILAMIQADRGESESAQAAARLAAARADELGQVFMLCQSRLALAYLHRQKQAWDAAVELFDECAGVIAKTDNRVSPLFIGAYHAEALGGQGRLEAAALRAAETLALAREAQSRHFESVTLRVQGQIFAAQDLWDDAAHVFDDAITTLDELGSRMELGRALSQRGLARQAQGDAEAARADLSRALALFEACGAKHDLEKTRVLSD